ncbi:MAG: TolC family protein [candidate division WOR-3 bacterium]
MMWVIAVLELTEDKAVEIALKNSPSILADSFDVLYAYEQSKEVGSSLWPSISLQFGYTYNSYATTFQQIIPTKWGFQEIPPGSGQGIVFPIEAETVGVQFNRHHNYRFTLSISRPLWSWWRMERGYQLQKENTKAKYNDYLSKKAAYEYNIRMVYTLALLSKEALKIAEENLKFSEKRLKLIEEAYKSGRANGVDYLRATADYESAKANLLNAENNYKSSLKTLALFIGLPDTVEIELKDSLGSEDKSLPQVEIQRYDIAYLEEQVKILESMSREELKGYLPTVLGQFSLNYQRPLGFEDKWGSNWTAGITLNWTLFDGLSPSVRSKKYKLQAEALKRRIEFLKLQAQKEIADAQREYEYAVAVLDAQEKGLNAMKKAFDLALEAYKSGRMTYTEFKQVELAYWNAKLSYKKAISDVKLAKLKVKFLGLTSLASR